MKNLCIILAIAVLFIANDCDAQTGVRTWTSVSGKTYDREFVKLEGDKVFWKDAEGKVKSIELEKLVPEDRKIAKELQAKKGGSDDEEAEEKTTPKKQSSADSGGNKSTTVTVEGVGSTYEKAKEDAFRNAVAEVVGTLVDSDTRVASEQIIEQIMTASNAYVEKHEILSRKQKDGLWEIKMKATVESRAMKQRLTATEGTNEVDGSRIVTAYLNKNLAEDEGILLLAKVLKDQQYPYSVMDVTTEISKEPVKREGDSVTMRLTATVTGNIAKFEAFRKAVEPVLDKIALSKGKMVLKQKQQGDRYVLESSPRSNPQGNKGAPIFLYVNTSRNERLLNTGWNSYKLSHKTALLLSAYVNIVPRIEIEMLDSDNNTIVIDSLRGSNCTFEHTGGSYNYTFSIGETNWRSDDVKSGSRICSYYGRDGAYDYSFAPFFSSGGEGGGSTNGFWTRILHRADITMTLKELSAIKKIKSRIDPNNADMDEYYKKLPDLLKNYQPE